MQLSLNAGQKYCRMLQGEHSAILSTFIKLPFFIKIFVLPFFEWLLKTYFTVLTTGGLYTFCFVEFIDSLNKFYKSEIFSQLKRIVQLGPLPWKLMRHSLNS